MSHDTILAVFGYAIFLLGAGIIAGKLMRSAREANPLPEDQCMEAEQHAYGPWFWSQDGWAKRCKFCGDWQYGGDDYDGGPK